eukprot:4432704-Prymnesium_polylepis.1
MRRDDSCSFFVYFGRGTRSAVLYGYGTAKTRRAPTGTGPRSKSSSERVRYCSTVGKVVIGSRPSLEHRLQLYTG